MPCLWPRPERGRISAAKPGSPMWIATPVGTSSVRPGWSSIGASIQARRSIPAEPGVAYAGRNGRIRSSRTLSSTVAMVIYRGSRDAISATSRRASASLSIRGSGCAPRSSTNVTSF